MGPRSQSWNPPEFELSSHSSITWDALNKWYSLLLFLLLHDMIYKLKPSQGWLPLGTNDKELFRI